MLCKLVITNPECEATDFDHLPWSEALLVTPRHAVRRHWNAATMHKHCHKTGHQLFICAAGDTIRGRTLTLVEHFGVAGRHEGADGRQRRQSEGLPDMVEMAVGMKVMVTSKPGDRPGYC